MKPEALESSPAGSPSPFGTTALSGRTGALRRVLSAAVFVPLFYILVRWLPPVALFGLVAAAAMVALREFYRLYFRERLTPVLYGTGLIATTLVLIGAQWPLVLSEQPMLLLAVGSALLVPLISTQEIRYALTDSAVLVLGIVYIGVTLGYVLRTRALPQGEFFVFFLVLITWAADTGAYLVGSTLGRHPLAPRLSPKKTIEGVVGGLLLALGMAFVARTWFLDTLTVLDCVALGVLLTLIGLLGDLFESALKRSAAVKDSGSLIPGHGGMLDRLDSLLFTGPSFYYYLTLVKGA